MKGLIRASVAPLLLLALWQCAASLGWASPYLLPPPFKVFRTGMTLMQNGVLFKNTLASLTRVAQGFTLSVILGCLCAWLFSGLPRLERALDPILGFLRMTPPLAMIPPLSH